MSKERQRISVTLVTTAAQGCVRDLCMCARVCVLIADVDSDRHDSAYPSGPHYFFQVAIKAHSFFHACMHMHVCMHVTTAAQSRLSKVFECALHVPVCVLLRFRSSIHCVCLSVCTCTSVCPDACIYNDVCIYNAEVLSMCNKHLMLGQTAVRYTHTYTHSHTFNTFTQAQYSVNRHEKHVHSQQRWKPGKNVGC